MSKWSISAHNAFRRCQRQYYFAHILAHHSARDTLKREAYVLKQLKDLKRWQGSLVDLGIQRFVIDALNDGRSVDTETVIAQTVELAKRQFEFSATLSYRNRDNAKSKVGDEYCGLLEHEYGLPVNEKYLASAIEIIDSSLSNLFKILLPNQQKKLIDFIRQANWRCANLQTLSFSIDEVRVTPQIDLLLFVNNRPVVIDWKAGENSAANYSRQLLICGLAVLSKWQKYQPKDIQLFEVNLLKSRIEQYEISQEKILEIEDFIFESNLDIESLSVQRDSAKLDVDDFDFANSPFTCQFCNFRKICTASLIKESFL